MNAARLWWTDPIVGRPELALLIAPEVKRNARRKRKPVTLTELQVATPAYVAMKCEITTRKSGTPQLRRLRVLGLLRMDPVYDGTMSCWTPTGRGRALEKTERQRGVRAMEKIGWA